MLYTILSVVVGLVFAACGLAAFWSVKAAARRNGVLWGITYVIAGVWGLTIGILRVAYALGHPLLSEEIAVVMFLVISLIGVIVGATSWILRDLRKRHGKPNA